MSVHWFVSAAGSAPRDIPNYPLSRHGARHSRESLKCWNNAQLDLQKFLKDASLLIQKASSVHNWRTSWKTFTEREQSWDPSSVCIFMLWDWTRECCPFPLFTSVTLLPSLDFNGAVQRPVYYMATIKKNKRPQALLHWFLRLLDCIKAFSCMIRRQQRVAFIIYSPTLRIFWCWFAAGASPPNSCYLRKLAGERWLHIRYGTNKNMSKSHILMWLYKHANLDYIHTKK